MVVSPKTEKVLDGVHELIKWLRYVAALLKGIFG